LSIWEFTEKGVKYLRKEKKFTGAVAELVKNRLGKIRSA